MDKAPKDLINVQNFISTLPEDDLIKYADKYWEHISVDSDVCYKPFMNLKNGKQNTKHLALVLEAIELYENARVLDFGCGAGWLTFALAMMKTKAVGVEISQKAVEVATKLIDKLPKREGYLPAFVSYNGRKLPFADKTFDRIICFDSFHHVANQQDTLVEFYRVLDDGGRVVMNEPAPGHSKTEKSQEEMRTKKIIENDIDLAFLSKEAEAIGFFSACPFLQFDQPVKITVDQHQNLYQNPSTASEVLKSLAQKSFQHFVGRAQCFSFLKPCAETNSSKPDGLDGELRILSVAENADGNGSYKIRVRASNTGSSAWNLCDDSPGKVQLAIISLNQDLSVNNQNYRRVALADGNSALSSRGILPENYCEVEFDLILTDPLQTRIRFELVAEGVVWFSAVSKIEQVGWDFSTNTLL